jgi:hypothetical protein
MGSLLLTIYYRSVVGLQSSFLLRMLRPGCLQSPVITLTRMRESVFELPLDNLYRDQGSSFLDEKGFHQPGIFGVCIHEQRFCVVSREYFFSDNVIYCFTIAQLRT